MADVEHASLTDPDLHEPKGASSASNKTVYTADGSGSGSWVKTAAVDVTVSDSESYFAGSDVETVLSELFEGDRVISGIISNISAAETLLIPIPFDCTVLSIDMILGGTLTGSDATVTVTRSDGAAMGTQVITFSGSVEGSYFEFVPSGNSSISYSTHKYIKLVTDGSSTGDVPLYCQVHLSRT